MNEVRVRGWIALATTFAGVLAGWLFLVPRVWRADPTTLQRIRYGFGAYWPFGEALLAGVIRALPVLVASLSSCAIGGALIVLFGDFAHRGGIGQVLLSKVSGALVIGFFVGVVFCLAVMFLNRPKLVVPPPMRGQRGAVQEWFRRWQ